MIILTDPVYKYEKLLRKLEYWTNCLNRGPAHYYVIFLRWCFQRMSARLGFSVPINVFGEGLCIVHYGTIVVSRHAKIGKWCTIHPDTSIAGQPDGKSASIGDYCFIGPGAKIINSIELGDNVRIGANFVVTKSYCGNYITLAGAPAKPVSQHAPRT